MVHSVLSNICHDLGWKLIWLTIKILSVFPFFHLWPLTIFSFLCNDARMVVWSFLKSDNAWSRLSEDYIILQKMKVNMLFVLFGYHVIKPLIFCTNQRCIVLQYKILHISNNQTDIVYVTSSLKNALLGSNYKIVFVPSREAKKLHALLRHVLVRIICVNGKIMCAYERVWVCISIKCMLWI